MTTGVSAQDRAHTVAIAVDLAESAVDIVSPGHVFLLVARDGASMVGSMSRL
ncbi:3,4-dihydroxy-2-butanone-4-phosphate synthase [Sphingomonas sp.]|uniref:3,4-dihydroxy-2-butanone-4-phosphate synthase n=1 Tax=Sphingomonas sp. TaxID=28214 RepID=UPI003AFFA7D2